MATKEECPHCKEPSAIARYSLAPCPACGERRYSSRGQAEDSTVPHAQIRWIQIVRDHLTGEEVTYEEFVRRKRAAGRPKRSAAEQDERNLKILGWVVGRLRTGGEVPTCREIAERFGCHPTTAARVLREAGWAQPRLRRRRRRKPKSGS
jgi:hypothetical protein